MEKLVAQCRIFKAKCQCLYYTPTLIFSNHFSGAALVAAAASSAVAAVAASGPVGAAVALPALGVGTASVVASSTSSTSFWDQFSTWPIFRLSGIINTDIWPFILTVFLIYVGIILLTDGSMLLNAISSSLNIGRSKYNSLWL